MIYIKHRPLIIAERHNASSIVYGFYNYLRNNPELTFDYCLFEGALDTKTHLDNAHNAFEFYGSLIENFIKSKDIHLFMGSDLSNNSQQFTEFASHKIDKKKYPHGFGQIRNLSVHFLLFQNFQKQNTQWIAIDDKRNIIKKYAEKTINDGTAYLYKQYKNVGNITELKQKILLEAAPIRSKYMSNKIFDYATKGKVMGLIGSRHCLDFAEFTPDLADIFGYEPYNNTDNILYHYNVSQKYVQFHKIPHDKSLNDYCRPAAAHNTIKIKSDFNLNNMYLNLIRN